MAQLAARCCASGICSAVQYAKPSADGWLQVDAASETPQSHLCVDSGLHCYGVPAIYIPYTAATRAWVQFLVRTEVDPLTCLHSIRTAIASVASDQQITVARECGIAAE
jgi:hypothetical protein